MECKHTYYEIIETYPKELGSRVPLFTIWNYIVYFSYITLINLKNIFSFKIKLGRKEEYKGREKNNYIEKDFIIPESKKEVAKENEVKKTITKFLKEKDAIKEIQFLTNKYGFDVEQLNFPITLKKRIEFIQSKNKCKDKVFITINKPKFMQKNKLFIKKI